MGLELIEHPDPRRFCDAVIPSLLEFEAEYCAHIGLVSNLVAHLTQRMLDEGRKFCFLHTDQANPTSNSIYQKIGYRPVCDSESWEFGEISNS